MRRAFVASQQDLFGGYLFDGQNLMFLTRQLPKDLMTFTVTSKEGQDYKMTVKNTKANIDSTDGRVLQIYNIIMRRFMNELKMQQVGHNLYDPNNKVKN
jgi:hypothetical protein